ncbi:hypothetical protein [Shewanella dokdonensis]|uniref:hypothetical protein n=1 Tax=Shewanella dokdonensis TaxID=712036 RepID=UPI001FD3DFCE|nr:hypothetical protein [Shewanella dokdonensis]
MSDAPVFSGFIEEFGLWTHEQQEAAKKIAAMAENGELKTFRVSVPDAQSKLRSKTLLPGAFKSALRDGVEFTSAYFSFDSAEGVAFNPFSKEGGLGMDEMHGFSNAILVPDPLTFRVLPWAPTVGWVLCDIYLRDGRPVPFDGRYQLKSAISRLKNLGFKLVTGLEVEFYVTRVTDQNLGEQNMGGLGVPPAPPQLKHYGVVFLICQKINKIRLVKSPTPSRKIVLHWGCHCAPWKTKWAPANLSLPLMYKIH